MPKKAIKEDYRPGTLVKELLKSSSSLNPTLDALFSPSSTRAEKVATPVSTNKAVKPPSIEEVEVVEEEEVGEEVGEEEEGEGEGEKVSKIDPAKEAEKLERTIFIGNLPISILDKKGKKRLEKLFKPFCSVESIRFRSLAKESEKVSLKVAYIRKKLHPKVETVVAYVVLAGSASQGDVSKGGEVKSAGELAIQALNNQLFDERFHLRVCWASSKDFEPKRTAFVGNLGFDLSEEDLRSHFSSCGAISGVRIIRDRFSRMGKGFGLIEFQDSAALSLAFSLNGTLLKDRPVRVHSYKASSSSSSSFQQHQTRPPRQKGNKKRILEGVRADPAKKFKLDKPLKKRK